MNESMNGELENDPPRFRGIIPPLVTPLSARDRLDQQGLARLLEHVVAGGVHGLFILGTTGEAPGLSYRLRRELIAQTCEIVAERVPVLVGVTDTAFVESLHLAELAAEAGATALVLSTPYYFPAGQTELLAYVRNFVAEAPLPVVLYNMPSLTKVWFEIDTLRELAALPGIVGVKDSSGDIDYFRRLVELKNVVRPDWSVMMGPEHLLVDSVRLGGSGGVCGGANLFPSLFVEAFAAACRGDAAAIAPLQQRIMQLQAIYEVGKYASRHIKATKCGLSLLGICDDFMTEPFHHFRPRERTQVRAVLERLAGEVSTT